MKQYLSIESNQKMMFLTKAPSGSSFFFLPILKLVPNQVMQIWTPAYRQIPLAFTASASSISIVAVFFPENTVVNLIDISGSLWSAQILEAYHTGSLFFFFHLKAATLFVSWISFPMRLKWKAASQFSYLESFTLLMFLSLMTVGRQVSKQTWGSQKFEKSHHPSLPR